jgi:hypothetical protein
VISLVLSLFFKTVFGIFLAPGLSQICKIRNFWKVQRLFSKNTLIPSSEKSPWSLKTSFWMKKCPTNSKMFMKISLFELIGQFFIQKDVFKLQEVFT